MSYGTVQAEKMTTESGYSLGAGNASSFKNRLINGDARVSQRNGTTATTGSDLWPVDRFNVSMGAGTFTGQQVADAPAGFTYSLKLTQATYGSASYKLLQQYVEGLNIADLAFGTASAKPLVLSFWVKASVTGTYTVTLQNAASGGSRLSYVSTYTVNSANTWEQKTIAVTGSTSGTWYTDNQRGIGVLFDLGSTPYATSTLNSWQSGNYFNATGSVDLSNNSGATWFVTGVQLEVGTVATSFDFRDYGTELFLCQRYFFQVSSTNAANGQNTGITGHSNGANELQRTNMTLPVTMRAVPTISVSNVKGNGTDLRVYNGAGVQTVNALGQQFSTINYLQADWTLAGSYSPTGQYLSVLWQDSVNGGWIRASAEL
jgi:hypothetical protein